LSKKRNTFESVIVLLLALTAFALMGPYFVWQSYGQPLFALLPQATLLVSSFATFAFLYSRSKKIDNNMFSVIILFISVWLYRATIGTDNVSLLSIGYYFFLFLVIGYLCLDIQMKARVFNVFSVVFALSLVSGIVIWFLLNIGINLPFTLLLGDHEGKIRLGTYYRKYFGAAFLYSRFSQFVRLSAVYDEPGVVGTFAALFLIADDFRFKKLKNIVIAIGGVLSLSLAFFLLTGLAASIRSIRKGSLVFAGVFSLIVVSYFVFMNLETNNPAIGWLQNRLTIDDSGLAGDNRASESFDYEFSAFLKDDIRKVIFGNGSRAAVSNYRMSGSFSYKMIIYDFGIFGFVLLLVWLVIAGIKTSGISWRIVVLIVALLLSIYQRPDVFAVPYIFLLIGGSANLRYSEDFGALTRSKVVDV